MKYDFFLGAISQTGFFGYFKELLNPSSGYKIYLIKAGPGCGKSTFMKKIAEHFEQNGDDVEIIHCSADVHSLDGVINKNKKFAILDATMPHSVEPKYPVAYEKIISFFSLLDAKSLEKSAKEIIELTKLNSALLERATRYITAQGSLINDSVRIASFCTDKIKLDAYIKRLIKKRFKDKQCEGFEQIRLLGAITPQGRSYFFETINKLAKEIVVLQDEYGFVSKTILKELRLAALQNGYEIISAYCPMSPYDKLEHLIIPQLSLAFTTENSFLQRINSGEQIVHAARFMDKELLKARKKRLRFNKTTINQLTEQAIEVMSEAKQVHDSLEKHYIAAMDFKGLDKLFDEIIADIG